LPILRDRFPDPGPVENEVDPFVKLSFLIDDSLHELPLLGIRDSGPFLTPYKPVK
jgi:hypothetical protein